MRKVSLSAGRPRRNNKNMTLSDLSDKPSMVRVNFDLSVEEHKKLKIYAAKQGITIKELLSQYVLSLPKE